MESNGIKVFARVRPWNDKADFGNRKTCLSHSSQKIVDVETKGSFYTDKIGSPGSPKGSKITSPRSSRSIINSFEVDHVFQAYFPRFIYVTRQATQEQVYDVVKEDVLQTFLSGINTTVFVYGQTGTGKTYTMQGESDVSNKITRNSGLMPRLFTDLFEKLKVQNPAAAYNVSGCMVEIYQERIRDLLSTTTQNLLVRESAAKGIYIEGCLREELTSAKQALSVLARGIRFRGQSATGMNVGSSRSHSIFTITLEKTVGKQHFFSYLNLVDLAGSERIKKSKLTGKALDEAKMINRSLAALGNVINSMSEDGSKSPRHIPYRDSKLTRILQESLGGNAKTWLILTISPSELHVQETLNTLRFGTRAKMIKNKAVVNRVRTVEELEQLLKVAERDIASLQKGLPAVNSVEGGDMPRKTSMFRRKGSSADIKELRDKVKKSEYELQSIPFPLFEVLGAKQEITRLNKLVTKLENEQRRKNSRKKITPVQVDLEDITDSTPQIKGLPAGLEKESKKSSIMSEKEELNSQELLKQTVKLHRELLSKYANLEYQFLLSTENRLSEIHILKRKNQRLRKKLAQLARVRYL
eukprot:maker-scaffold_2-snap-gene-20.34-mRNA-1 protein AED:0.34 eAED:0.34 QI:0/0/0/0.5/1/1/8/0/583